MPSIPDPGLRRALNLALHGGMSTNPPSSFPDAEIAALTQLSWSGEGEAEAYPKLWKRAESLIGLEGAIALKTIAMGGNHIQDLDPLAGCVALEELWLGENAVRDLRPIARLPKLRRLSLYDNGGLSELGPLADATALRILDVGGTAVRDFSPLLGLSGLVELKAGRGYGEPLPDESVEQLGALRARGVAVRAGQDQARVDQAAARLRVKPAPKGDAVAPLLSAAGRDELLLLWQSGGVKATDDRGNTLLHHAVSLRPAVEDPTAWQLLLIRALGAAGATVERVEFSLDHQSPLGLACGAGVPGAVFDAVLSLAKKPNFPPHRPPLATLLAATRRMPPEELERRLQALLSKGAKLALPPVLRSAAAAGRLDLVERAVAGGVALNARSKDGETALSLAARNNDLPILERLLAAGADPHTALASLRSAEAVHMVAARGANLNAPIAGGLGETLLHRLSWWALSSAVPEEQLFALLEALNEHGVNWNARNHRGRTPLMALVERPPYDANEKARLLRLLPKLVALGAHPNWLDADNKSAAGLCSDAEVRATLRELPSGPPCPDPKKGEGPLFAAIEEPDPDRRREAILARVAEGADIAAASWSGNTPLHAWLIAHGRRSPDEAIFRALLCRESAENAIESLNYFLSGARGQVPYRAWLDAMVETGIDLSRPAVFLALLRMGQVDLVERALAAGASITPETPGDARFDPLVVAANSGHAEVVDLLLAAGAPADGDPFHDMIPLLQTSSPAVIGSLLASKANPNARAGLDARTPLHHICSRSMPEPHRADAIQRLLAAGADPKLRDSSGKTPADLLRERNLPVPF